jgi:hypothetical protein
MAREEITGGVVDAGEELKLEKKLSRGKQVRSWNVIFRD